MTAAQGFKTTSTSFELLFAKTITIASSCLGLGDGSPQTIAYEESISKLLFYKLENIFVLRDKGMLKCCAFYFTHIICIP